MEQSIIRVSGKFIRKYGVRKYIVSLFCVLFYTISAVLDKLSDWSFDVARRCDEKIYNCDVAGAEIPCL